MIRLATKFDMPRLIEMLWDYHDSGNLPSMEISDDSTAKKILTRILVGGGIALVSEKDGHLNGMLLALLVPYLWDDSALVVSEIAYWVDAEQRGGSAGYRLLKEYTTRCNDMVEQKKIKTFTVSHMEGQQLNYARFGFKPVEHTWSM